jgi:hypothetical protein
MPLVAHIENMYLFLRRLALSSLRVQFGDGRAISMCAGRSRISQTVIFPTAQSRV